MSTGLAYAGATLLAAATLPQAARLLRARTAGDMGWSFIALNLAGIGLLGLRSLEIREWGFVAVNAVTAGFWALALATKLREARAPGAPPRALRRLRILRKSRLSPCGDSMAYGAGPPARPPSKRRRRRAPAGARRPRGGAPGGETLKHAHPNQPPKGDPRCGRRA